MPITGGTMLVTRDSTRAVVADPDRDRILTIDLTTDTVLGEIALTAGDEPGRVIEDGAGRIHVALRRGGSIVTLADASTIADQRFACTEPRGLAFEAATDSIHVACAGGELVTFPAAGGNATRVLRLERDLRDVIVSGGNLVVSTFRKAELITVDALGVVTTKTALPSVPRFGGGGIPFSSDSPPSEGGLVDAKASVAWRTIALPDGRIVISHQRQAKPRLDTEQEGGYGTECGGSPVESAVTVMTPGQPPVAVAAIARGALPVDIAVSPTGDKLAVVLAAQQTVTVVGTTFALSTPDMDDCRPEDDDDDDDDDKDEEDDLGAPTSAAFTASGEVVIFYPDRNVLVVRAASGSGSRRISLPGEIGYDQGRSVFHAQTAVGLACASCHPEGREDGLVWEFAQIGQRRTQSLAGHILERAPYHWNGDMANLGVLMDDVFAVRMAGGELTLHQKAALGPWLDRIPAPPSLATADAATIARGESLFESSGCLGCHNGDLFTNNALVNVGTSGLFKVPSLRGIASRAPYMHTGCAATLQDRFSFACGGGDLHGNTSHLSPSQIDDLVAYLESL